MAVLGLTGVGPSRGSAADVHPQGPAAVTIPAETDLDQPDMGLGPGDGGPADADQPGPDVDQAGDPPDVDEPQPQPPVAAVPATLSVTPDPVHLKAGVYTGSITVANVGDEPMRWSALTKPWVTLSDATGDLGAHGENVITFTVDPSGLDAGAKPVTDII